VVSVLSLGELYEGICFSRDPVAEEAGLKNFLLGAEVVGIDEEVTRIFGRERGRLRRSHKTVSDMDLLIGATAIRHDLTLLTNNRRHFEPIETLRIVSP
jgi:tRNA(fMet)-specific endonuclease VapC